MTILSRVRDRVGAIVALIFALCALEAKDDLTGKPSVVYAATGAIDTAPEGITGKVVPAGDRQAFAAALVDYFHNPALRAQHGASAVDFAVSEFRPEQIWAELELEIRQLPDQRAP